MAGVAARAAGGGAASAHGAGTQVMRLVLDTNVWLDWLVFDEPSLMPLRAAQAAGRVEIVMDEACEAELARVLAYDLGKHTIGAEEQARCMEQCRSLAKRVVATAAADLPRCSDPHDQKFLELALAAQADVLVTKDRALLDLARRKLPFRIAAPHALGAL
jgi:putative PIN family toxin of toxin-antitoxin system